MHFVTYNVCLYKTANKDDDCDIVQGLFVPFARVGSGDPVRVLCLLHNKYAGYN